MNIEKKQEDLQDKINKKIQKGFEQEEKSITGFFVRNYRFTYLLIGVIILLGIYSLITLPKESDPEVKVPYAVVTTVYAGATPTDMEELITDKIENEISNLENLKDYTSSSGQGISSIFVEFEAEADLKESFRKLRESVDNVEGELPDNANTPMVTEIRLDDMPIVTYSLVGDYGDSELKKYADILQEKLENIRDVSEAQIIGGLTREFQIVVNQTRLANFNISLSQIVNAINTANFDLPAGDIEIDGFKYNIRLKGKFEQLNDLHNVVITTLNESPVMLGDIAEIIDGHKEKTTESKIGIAGEVAKNTISLQIYKSTEGNILNIAKEANQIIESAHEDNLIPENLKITKTNDNSVFIKDDIKTLGSSGIETVILITLILLMVLSFRGALITAMTVPIAFMMSFFGLNFMDMTINSMVLFSLVLSLGLMVDNSIVIIEGINEYISKYKKNVYEAAILAIWNFKWAIISGTTTTIAAFIGMFFVSGIMGEYLSIIPKTLIITLSSSLFVAIVVIPTLASRLMYTSTGNGSGGRNKRRHKFIAEKMEKLQKKYRSILENILPKAKVRRKIILSAWAGFFIAMLLPILGIMRIEMFPTIDFDYFYVNVELPVGSTLDKTKKITEQVEESIAAIPELDNYVINLGSAASNNVLSSQGGSNSHLASITVNLSEDRERESFDISKKIREEISNIQGAIITVEDMQAGPPTGAPIEVRVFGDDIANMSTIVEEIKDYFENVDGVINIADSIENSAGEFTFSIDKQKANYYGLSVASIASTLRNAIYGTEASTINIDDEDVDITVKYAKSSFANTNDIENILLFTPTGNNIPLKQVASLNIEPALTSIAHKKGEKILSITADIEEGANLREITENFNQHKETLTLPANTSIEIGGETEDIQKSFTEMFASLIIAIILIYTILVLMFNSFKQPFIIVFTLPLAIPGVIVGLLLMGQAFSITAFIGIVALAGIVVNGAIVLIDKINKNIEDGMEFHEAIIDGGISRMQPILITSITTIIGVFPLLFAEAMWIGLSISIMFGLAFSTLLTLIVVPITYAGLCKKECAERKKLSN